MVRNVRTFTSTTVHFTPIFAASGSHSSFLILRYSWASSPRF